MLEKLARFVVELEVQRDFVDGRRRPVHLVGVAAHPLEDLVAPRAPPRPARRCLSHTTAVMRSRAPPGAA
jgi:hypothetical protein